MANPPTAINKETGQRLVLQNGKWTPVGATGVMSDTKTDQEQLNTIREAAKRNEYMWSQADEFGKLNRQTGTGQLAALPGIQYLARAFNPDFAAMDAITSRVAPQMRVPGSGSSSDTDVRMFRQSFPNVDFPGDANKKIRERIYNEADTSRQYADFADQWYARNGTLLGMDKAWGARGAGQHAASRPNQPQQQAFTIDIFGRPVK